MIFKWIRSVACFADKCKKDNIGAFAAQSAFFLLLSLIPFLMVFSSLLQYTVVSEATLLKYVNSLAPEYIAPFVVSIIHEVYHKSVGIVSVTAGQLPPYGLRQKAYRAWRKALTAFME